MPTLLLETAIRDSEVTRLAVALVDNGQTTETYVLAKKETEPLQCDTIWTVASLTKPVFAYGVMLLAERRIIDLDRSLQDYLPCPYTDDVFVPQMTARQCLSHTTGFPNWRDAQGLRSAFMPGTKFSYSSEGLTYLQHVVEHLIQMPLAVFLDQHVFAPLGMRRTSLELEAPGDLPPMLHFLTGTLLANGALSLRTTIEDYARFVDAVWNTLPSVSLLGSHSLDEMLRPQIEVSGVPDLHWGLGWGLQYVSSVLSFWHWGARGMPKTMSFVMGIPSQKKAIVIFTDHANGLVLCKDIIELWIGESTTPAFEWLLPAQEWRPDGKKRVL
jgi:CubicO group peptidase (beta-lactamase class C family)